MVEDHEVSFSLEVNVQDAYVEVRRLQTILYRSLGLARRLGGENLEQLVTVMQRTITIANRLRLALRALQLARMAAGDPLAWALAGISGVEVAIDIGDVFIREETGSEGPQ